MNILAIETSCDETAIAILNCSGTLKSPKFKILKNVISSQIAVHRPFGGVVPNLAKREHIKNLPIVLRQVLGSKVHAYRQAGKSQKLKVDCIAVTVGPGLEPALWTGINFAKELSEKIKKPIIGINHMEAHLYSNWLPKKSLPKKIIFPAVALIVSGGHTILLKMKSITEWERLGETLDDAAGEVFDKVARMLKLPYPGGPEIQKIAGKGNENAIKFPRPLLNLPAKDKNYYNFSFSGLKTSVLYYLRDNPKAKKTDVAASFQKAVIDTLVKKTIHAAQEHKAKSILLCGGVAANKALRDNLQQATNNLQLDFIVPDFQFNTDNAAMIAAAAYINLLSRKKRLAIGAQGNLTI